MSPESRRISGILLVALPTVMFSGVTLLNMLIGNPACAANPLRQGLWRAGHAHAGVLLVLSLVMLRYVDEARLSGRSKAFVRFAVSILMPLAFFLSVLSPGAREPNATYIWRMREVYPLPRACSCWGFGLLRRGE
jgi:hypothetical protein